MAVRAWVGLLVLLALPALARAAEPLPPPPTDLTGPRGLAMGGALRASGTSNDAVFLNPAAILGEQRYNLSVQGLLDFNGGQKGYGLALSDSTTGPVAAGLAVDRLWLGHGDQRTVVNMFNLSLATSISQYILIGVGGKMLHYADGDGKHNRLTPDAGILLKIDPVAVGFTAYNLISIASPLAPRQYAGSLAVSVIQTLHLEADVVLDTSTRPDTSMKYEFGAEWQAISLLALRAGYVEDRILGQRAVSGGVGVNIPGGIVFDAAYRHEFLGEQPGRIVMAGVSLAF